jgi:hypothetical protein
MRHDHGALRNYTTFDSQPGRIGTALQFNGTTHWVRVADSTSLDSINTSNRVSVSAWVKKNANQTGWSVVTSRQYQTGGAEHYGLAFLDNRPTWLIATQLTGTATCSSGTASGTGVWIHLAGTWDGATARLYVNGTQICTFARSVTLAADATPLIIGGNANSSADDAQEKFNGVIDDLAIYNRALTASEVSAIAAGGAPPSN